VGRGVEKPSSGRTRDSVSSFPGTNPETAHAVALLQEGPIAGCQPIYSGSNSVFLLSIAWKGRRTRAIYKPRDGEAPLWDFPDGTLYRRERAAFLVSEALGWRIVPATVIRRGPYGVGVVQWFVSSALQHDYRSFLERHEGDFRRIAIFDCLVNNADRKVGHCLLGEDGKVWGIDHGLTFHRDPKLRTVIWDFAGEPVPHECVLDLKSLRDKLSNSHLRNSLEQLLADDELEALSSRLRSIIERPYYPVWSGSYRSVPWPPF
jgi:hypothetical protein